MSYNTASYSRDTRVKGGRYTNSGSRSGGRSSFSGGGGKRGPAKSFIHPSKFVRAAKPITEDVYVPTHTFNDFAVDDLIKRNIAVKGYTTPSPIQDQTIPLGLEGRDVIGIANTGTGKTVAFALPVLQKLITNQHSKVLVMAPTRELAQQIEQEFRTLAKTSGLFGTILIGGTAMGPQLRDLRDNPRIVIGTPGRIKDHMERGSLKLTTFNLVVLDEVDRMLDMGFINDIRTILSQCKMGAERQSFFFSATLDSKVSQLISAFANDPVTISVKTGDTADSVHQDIIPYSTKEDRMEQLHNLLIKPEVEKVIVFDETKYGAERLSKELIARGFNANAIHGGKTQAQRQKALQRFKNSEINILVATDVAARGIDVADITHVINYSLPNNYEDYTHRVGRAGRAGRVGYAFTFVTE
jgi:ATP-dependent RNA helicase RhlE